MTVSEEKKKKVVLTVYLLVDKVHSLANTFLFLCFPGASWTLKYLQKQVYKRSHSLFISLLYGDLT